MSFEEYIYPVDGSEWYSSYPIVLKKDGWLGFVYIIVHEPTGHFYIGKKQFVKAIRRKPLKGKKRARLDRVESDWRTYMGSSIAFKNFIKYHNNEGFKRIILSTHLTKRGLALAELQAQLDRNAMLNEKCFNGIINVRLAYHKLIIDHWGKKV